MSNFVIQDADAAAGALRPFMQVAVLMRREALHSPWQAWRWTLDDVVPQQNGFGLVPRLLRKDGDEERWLHPGFRVELFADDAEGYYLNVSTPQPCFWVMWRLQEEDADAQHSEPLAVPHRVTLSYHDAGRWLDAQETVEQVPAAPDVVQYLREFVEKNRVPEVKRRQRPQSFQALSDRFGQPARISTEKIRGGGGHEPAA